jgi:hypothetical protein
LGGFGLSGDDGNAWGAFGLVSGGGDGMHWVVVAEN